MRPSLVTCDNGSLWGKSGGQLEYVSQRVEWRPDDSRMVMVIRFTDHDHAMDDIETNPDLIEGRFYELEFPMEPQ